MINFAIKTNNDTLQNTFIYKQKIASCHFRKLFFFVFNIVLEPIPGLEPGTYSLRMNCSTN